MDREEDELGTWKKERGYVVAGFFAGGCRKEEEEERRVSCLFAEKRNKSFILSVSFCLSRVKICVWRVLGLGPYFPFLFSVSRVVTIFLFLFF